MQNKILLLFPQDISQKLSLRANFSWTFVGNVIFNVCQWGTLIILSKLGSPDMVGLYALALAIQAPVMMFAGLQMRIVQATDAKNEYEFGHYFALRIFTTSLAFLTISAIAVVSDYSIGQRIVILVIALAKVFEAMSDVFYGLFQKQERLDKAAISLMLRGPLSLVFFSLGIYITNSVLGGVLGLVVSGALILILYDVRNSKIMMRAITINDTGSDLYLKALKPRWEYKTLLKLAWLILPLGFASLLVSLTANIPRYFLEFYGGVTALGIFAALDYFRRVGQLIIQALGQATTPRLSQYYAAQNGRGFTKLFIRLVMIGLALGIAGVLVTIAIGKPLVTLMYTPEYAQQDIFILIMIAAGLSYVASFLRQSLTAVRRLKIQLVLKAIDVTSLIVFCWILIPVYGMRGAATAMIISRIVEVVLAIVFVLPAVFQLQKQRAVVDDDLKIIGTSDIG